jgi:hypothetical protein
MKLHIHSPSATAKRAVPGNCPDCKKRTRFLEFFTPWYGWNSTCIRCGRQWNDGQWMSLDFYRFARRDNITRAKAKYRAMPPVSENNYSGQS